MKSFKIGNIKISNPVFLSPMVDVTDLAYRSLCREWIGMAYTEMLYVDAILNTNKKTQKLMKTCKEDSPVGLQITGNNPEEFKKLAKLTELKNYDLIDINCGCPSLRIVGSSAGSFLLESPEKIGEMIKMLKVDNIVTAKIRLGYKKNNVLEVAKSIEKSGADALTIHARLAVDGNNVKADWKWIKKIKREIGIPVIGNGDVLNGEKAAEMLDICDGVMVARGAIGNPLIFREIQRYLRTGKEKEISKKERIDEFRKYLRLVKMYDLIDLGRIKFLGGKFLKRFEGSVKMRGEFMPLKTFEEIDGFLDNL